MPRHGDFNPGKVSANQFFVFPKGFYRLKVVTLKTFDKINKAGEESYGVRAGLECVDDGDLLGKKASFACYMQSEGGRGIAKNLQMAVHGYDPKDPDDEAEFNEKCDNGEYDWSIDFDTPELGASWEDMKGNVVMGLFDVKIYNSVEQQDFKGWVPVKE